MMIWRHRCRNTDVHIWKFQFLVTSWTLWELQTVLMMNRELLYALMIQIPGIYNVRLGVNTSKGEMQMWEFYKLLGRSVWHNYQLAYIYTTNIFNFGVNPMCRRLTVPSAMWLIVPYWELPYLAITLHVNSQIIIKYYIIHVYSSSLNPTAVCGVFYSGCAVSWSRQLPALSLCYSNTPTETKHNHRTPGELGSGGKRYAFVCNSYIAQKSGIGHSFCAFLIFLY